MPDNDEIKIGLALGGGGSRALTHLGVLTALEKEGVRIHCVSGSSMGGLLGAMYAFEPDAGAVREKAHQYFARSPLFGGNPKPGKDHRANLTPNIFARLKKYMRTAFIANVISARKSLLRRNPSRKAAATLLPDKDISETQLPFASVALDLNAAAVVTLKEGNVRRSVEAGTAIGVVFPPHKWDEHLFVDAAPLSSVPVRACKNLGADVVIAVDIRTPVPERLPINNGFDVISRIESIESRIINDAEANEANVLLKPEVGKIGWWDFTRVDEIVHAGEIAVTENIDAIRAAVGRE